MFIKKVGSYCLVDDDIVLVIVACDDGVINEDEGLSV